MVNVYSRYVQYFLLPGIEIIKISVETGSTFREGMKCTKERQNFGDKFIENLF